MTKSAESGELVADSLASLVQSAVESYAPNDDATRARVLLRAAVESSRAPRRPRWQIAVPALAAACALLVWWRVPSALRYEVIGAKADGAYLSAPADHPIALHFSDDTLVRVLPGSQLRVEDTSRQGARVLLERGVADVHVVHREHAHWTFAAGPFEVLVTGTRFDLQWDPTRQVLDLELHEGSVEIQTPFGAAPVALHGGQDFHADLGKRSMTTTDSAAEPAARPEPAAPPADSALSPALDAVTSSLDAASAAASTASPSSPAPAAPVARAWSKLVASGEFAALLEQADERGIASCLRGCSAGDLSALADAARYTGRRDLANQSLQALRTRFSHDPEGRAAAFLLGRLQEAQGAPSAARTWYERYLIETPGGAYAAEALAGKMRTTQKLEGQSAAEPIAREYLQLYPTGVQAGTARGILGSH